MGNKSILYWSPLSAGAWRVNCQSFTTALHWNSPPAGEAGSCTLQCLFPNIHQFQQLTVVHFVSDHLPAIRRKHVSGETIFLIRLFTVAFSSCHPSVHLRTFDKLIFSTETLVFCCIFKQFSPKTHRYP